MNCKRKSSTGNDNSFLKKKSSQLPKINSAYKTEDFLKSFEETYKKTAISNGNTSGCFVSEEPFKHCYVPNFLEDENFLTELKDEILGLDFIEKNNDLYKFSQTDDFKNSDLDRVTMVRKLFHGEVLDWLKNITGIPLNSTVDLTASKYDYTDVLLCHDDELEGRRIAFILYLVPLWCKDDGGMLDLFSVKDHMQPSSEPCNQIVPKWNTFVFFEVTQESFHQVSEVLNPDKCRLSLNGWFHGPPVKRRPALTVPQAELERPYPLESDELLKWINPAYFDPDTQLQIRTKFEEDCEIELSNFLKLDKFQQMSCELQESSISWTMLAPSNKRHYEEAVNDSIPETVNDCLHILQSEPFFLFLSTITGLTLHPLADNKSDKSDEDAEGDVGTSAEENNKEDDKDGTTAASCVALSRWRHGSYTLISDHQDNDCGLDLRLFFNCAGWQQEFGGFMSYIAKNEDEELLCISPNENALALVYRDAETAGFVKYINKDIQTMNSKGEFYSINALYVE